MVWVLSLSIPHGMHLVIPTHPYFFWVVCHPNRTFPQKSLSRNPRISFPLSPPPGHTLLPLTHDPPPPVLAGYRLVKSGPRTCSTFVCVQNLPAAFAMVWRLVYTSCCPSLISYGVSYFLIPHSLWPTPFRGWLTWLWAFLPLAYSFALFRSLATISYHTTLPFLLWCYLTPACWAF